MDDLTILQQARRAGLTVEASGDQLVIRGSRTLSAWVAVLREHKAEVLVEIGCERSATGTTVPTGRLTELTHGHAEPPAPRIDDAPVTAGLPPRTTRLPAPEFLDTIAAQHCHPAVLADRLGLPLPEVLRRLEASPWSSHGARHRARLGLTTASGNQATGTPERPAPPESDLHFPAR